MHVAYHLDGVATLKSKRYHWICDQGLDELIEEGSFLMLGVVGFNLFSCRLKHLHADNFESLILVSGDDLAYKASLDRITFE